MTLVTLAGGLLVSASFSYNTFPVDASIKRTEGAVTVTLPALSPPVSSSAMTAILPERQNRTDAISIAIHFFTSYLFIWHLLHCRILPAKICLSHQERSGNRS